MLFGTFRLIRMHAKLNQGFAPQVECAQEGFSGVILYSETHQLISFDPTACSRQQFQIRKMLLTQLYYGDHLLRVVSTNHQGLCLLNTRSA
ncbi:Uncharacterised protein [Vibrio cholerae]|uniref:Uncharacterized protein n=1 Tax=Vibrio cholerae TaxID=666 RepID=A0A655QA76_VIBCL|nr:Uncharacterised protein [Vibrio cholerae]CSA48992.1 Uncharacterised protein [Vibrio cholerae]